jgi:hypothetical protein
MAVVLPSKLLAITLAGVLATPAVAFEVRPNPNITSGSVRIDAHDVNATCGHSKSHRGSMGHARRDEILTSYGLPPGDHPDFEIDHLIPLCLGGADDPSNLWPEPRRSIEPKWNAEAKDRLERFLCDMVCSRQLDIAIAQEAVAKDWIAAYHKYYETKSVGEPANTKHEEPRSAIEAQVCSGCGCRGGPGYRGPDGNCVGWKVLSRVCGTPPTTRCTPELVNSGQPTKPKRGAGAADGGVSDKSLGGQQ